MRRLVTTVLAATAFLTLGTGPASAYDYGSNFGFAEVNSPGKESAPAFDGQTAIWAGTCDLTSGDTSNGGVGSAPATRLHCIDLGSAPVTSDTANWAPGGGPAWRLRPVTQAAAHPDATLSFRFNRAPDGNPDGNVKDAIVKLPLGFVGNPEATPKCLASAAQDVPPDCPPEAQTGVATLFLHSGEPVRNQPIYGIEARDTVTAEFTIANVSALVNVPVTARGRTNSDYGVDTLALLIPTYLPVMGTAATLWGVPWAEEHDKYRIDALPYFSFVTENIPAAGLTPENGAESYDPSWGPIKPFVTNPTSCSSGTPTLVVEADSWQDPANQGGPFVSASAQAPDITGCDQLEFDPSITLKPTVAVADSPSGLDVVLKTPQNNDPPASIPGNPDLAHDPADDTGAPAYWRTDAGLATAHLKDTTVHLPVGTSFNPAAANGVRGCTTAQIGLTSTNPVTFNNDEVRCPEESKVGTLDIVTPLLPDPLSGDIYAAPQSDNPFPGTLTAIYLVSQDEERGLSVKLAGKVELDPQTGQIATTFVDNPQLPFDEFELHLKSGPRAPLNTPAVCGQFENAVDLIPWSFPDSGPQPTIKDPFTIGAMPNGLGCVTEPEDRVFGPGFEANSRSTLAKSYTDFLLNVTRADGHQEVSALGFKAPPGLSANLTETPYCPEFAIEAAKLRSGLQESLSPSCPEASQMGTVTALAGAGSQPLPTEGRLYIAGPYDPDGAGPQPLAPFSTVVIAPAIAGGDPGAPTFDLGNVVIRSAGYIDPRTAHVTIASTRVPYIVGGVPLRIRRILVAIEKPNFMINPTSCAESTVGGTLGGAADPFDPNDDISLEVSNRFQVGGCKDLGFKPKLDIRLFGGTKRAAYQRLKAVLTPRPGDANIAKAAVTLPRSAFLAQEHIRTVCTRVQFAQDACPEGSVYGHATAYTPLLKDPVSGPVILRSSDNPLPDMVASLQGQFDFELVGRIDSVKGGGIRSTFDIVPDAPVTKFVLNMFGGKRSLIVNSKNICRFPSRATVRMSAHNGRQLKSRPKVKNSCGKGRKGKGGKGKGRGGGNQKRGTR